MNIFARKILICVVACFMLVGGLASARGKISKNVGSPSKVMTVSSLEYKESIKQSKLNFCGDGVLDLDGIDDIEGTFYDEQCDDGNVVSGDGCSSVCLTEVIECIELFEINFDINQDGFSDVGDIITARGIILGLDPIYNDGSCGDRFLPVTRGGPVLGAEGVCCPEGVTCDLYCNGYLSVSDLVVMGQIIVGTFQGDICGVEVCEEVEDMGSVTVTPIELTNVSAQVCSENVDVAKFTIENDGEADLLIDAAKFQAYVDTGSFDIADYVETARLRVRTDAGYQLLDEVPSNDFMGQMIVFDDFTYSIPVGSSIEFLVTVDAKEELGSEFFPPLRISLVGANIETVGGATVCDITQLGCAEADSMRVISFIPNATLEVSVVLDDPLAAHAKYVLAGSELDDVPFVAAFEVIAEFGAIEIEDIYLNIDGDVENLRATMNEIVLYDDDFNVIASEAGFLGNFNVISFDNIGYEIQEGISNIYVKVTGDLTGDNENGVVTQDIQLSLWIGNNTEIVDCGEQTDVIYDGIGHTFPSHEFAIVPVSFSNYQFVTTTPLGEYEVDFFINSGQDEVFAILEFTASERDNTDIVDGSELEILIDSILFSNVSAEHTSNTRTVRLGSSNILSPIEAGETAYFILLGDVDVPAGESSTMAVQYDAIDNSIEYRSSDGTFITSQTRLGIGTINAPEVTIIGS